MPLLVEELANGRHFGALSFLRLRLLDVFAVLTAHLIQQTVVNTLSSSALRSREAPGRVGIVVVALSLLSELLLLQRVLFEEEQLPQIVEYLSAHEIT